MAVASISGELINAMAAASSMTKQNLILIAQWKKQEMMDELQRRNVSFSPRAKKEELFQVVIHASILERRREGDIESFIRRRTQSPRARHGRSRS